MTLAEFLLARIAEDEAAWRHELAYRGSGTVHPLGHPCDPARVLAECEAKRRILEWATTEGHDRYGVGPVLNLLALPYADHPDYRAEWRPLPAAATEREAGR